MMPRKHRITDKLFVLVERDGSFTLMGDPEYMKASIIPCSYNDAPEIIKFFQEFMRTTKPPEAERWTKVDD